MSYSVPPGSKHFASSRLPKEKASASLPPRPLGKTARTCRITRLLPILLGLSLCAPQGAAADPAAKRGRAPDGRAFRVDKEGMQITDYIAELEVTVDDLRRQVHALEDELDEKRDRLDQLASGKPAPQLKETNLVGQERTAAPDCSLAIAPLRAQVQQLQAAEQQLRAAEQQRQLAAANGSTQAQAQIQQLEHALEQSRSEGMRNSDESKQLAADLMRAKSDLDNKDLRIAELESKVTSLDAQLSAPAPQARAALARAEEPAPVVKRIDPPALAHSQSATPPAQESSTTLSLAEIAPVRAELNESLQQIQILIIQRKDLSDSAGKRSKGVSIALKPLVSANGTSLDALRAEVRSLSANTRIDTVRSGLNQIQKILQDDIETLRRLKSI